MAQTRFRPPEMIVRSATISEWPAAGGSMDQRDFRPLTVIGFPLRSFLFR
ncbi:MAG: hypothetical protein CM1200mP2_16760 [Planctomycetaceae bacterium]|nr:MAG: hypothetical protein CM1200mP2_16760 [Planctomycetaceae bacterium]